MHTPQQQKIRCHIGYVQITYAEFCRIRNTTENYKASHWFIPVQGVLLEVPKDAYKAFYREKERERYLRKLDSALFLCNLDLKSEEIPLRDESTDIEQQTEDRLMIEKMYSCLRLLDPDDAEFIRMYFFQHVSRKELAKKYGVHPSNTIRKADEMQVVKDICTYCQVRRGMDYILIKKKIRGDANDNDR